VWTVTELLESAGGVAGVVALVVLVGFVAYWVFGPQAIGLPAIIGVLAVWGLVSLVSNAGLGPAGILVVVVGVVAVLFVIGMAMRLGADPPTRSDADRAGEDSWRSPRAARKKAP
jgi:hypothetical protein